MERLTKEQILAERKEIEQDIATLLNEVKSDFTLEDVKAAIYNESEQNDMSKIIPMFDTDEGKAELGEILELITDAWNYFPHKTLGGKSPKEAALERYG